MEVDLLLTQARQWSRDRKPVGLELGDLLCRLEKLQRHDDERVEQFRRRMATALETSRAIIRQQHWVAQRFPPGHAIRSYGLSFSVLRLLVPLEDQEALRCADSVQQDKLSVRQLKALLPVPDQLPTSTAKASRPAHRNGEAAENPLQTRCHRCGARLLRGKGVVLTVDGGPERPYCGVACAVEALLQSLPPN